MNWISRWRDWLLLIAVLAITDTVTAQFLKAFYPNWDPVRTSRQRAQEHAANERKYRVRSDIYHHDLAKRVEAIGSWGPLRYPVRTNSLGFRDSVVREVPLRSAHRRLLLIGDSFTEGIGLEYDKTYASIITRELGQRGTEVLNAGVVSYSPAIYYAKTRYLIEKVGFHFDELVIFLDISDIEDEARYYRLDANRVIRRSLSQNDSLGSIGFLGAENIAPQSVIQALKSALRNNSVILHVIDVAKDRLQGANPSQVTTNARAAWTVSDSAFDAYGRLGLERATENMNRLAAMVRQRGIKLTVCVYPWPTQVLLDSANSIQVRYWRQWADSVGSGFIDLFAPILARPDRSATVAALYIPGDVHFSEAGHALVARAFLEAYLD